MRDIKYQLYSTIFYITSNALKIIRLLSSIIYDVATMLLISNLWDNEFYIKLELRGHARRGSQWDFHRTSMNLKITLRRQHIKEKLRHSSGISFE